MKVTHYQHDILVGTILGDACVQWNRTRTKARVCLRQKNKAYMDHLVSIFGEFITCPPRQNKQTGVWECDTRSVEQFRFYRQQFYDEQGRKRIPRLIHRWLTPRAIAYWYMDDGALKWRDRSSGIRLCTDCFTRAEVRRLCRVLTALYQVEVTTFRQRDNLRIYVSGRGANAIEFGHHFLPYVHPAMYHKIPPQWFAPWTDTRLTYTAIT